MDGDVVNNEEESFLKIGMIWSEAEENFDKITIKEEIESEDESKSKFFTFEDGKIEQEELEENSTSQTPDQNEPPKSEFAKSYALLWQEKNNMLSKDENDGSEMNYNTKPWCPHNVKNFVLSKNRLRCSGCKALVCPECCNIYPVLQNHLTDPLTRGFFTCKSCPLAFHSFCALQAHLRIHTLESPHVCPDCGLIYNNVYYLILHLINKCHHVYKIARYKCQSCPDTYFTPSQFINHLKEKHITKKIKCSYCSLMFNTQYEFGFHLDALHFKQKIHRLSYYCCLLCSNMIIPEAMFQKHIDQHYDTPEGYDIDYQCCCGESFHLVSLFRAHINCCPKKGILPSYWKFLQNYVGSQNGTSEEGVQDDQDPLEQNSENHLDSLTDLNLYNSTISSNNLLTDKNRDENMVSDEPGADDPSFSVENNEDLIDFSQGDSEEVSGGLTSTNKKSTRVSVNSSPLKYSNSVGQTNDGMDVQNVDLLTSGSKESEGQHPVQECSTTLVGDRSGSNKSEKSHRQTKQKNGTQVDSDASKMGYDHIPCDHLGYLRIQCSDLNKTETIVGEIKCSEGKLIPSSSVEFQTVTELDDRTGLMRTRKIPIETIYEDETDGKDESSEDSSGGNNSSREMFNGDRVKVKLSGNAYFMCPFCVVLFPKGITAFQQFRLHMECYHSDAALNITVHQSEREKPENHCETTNRRGRSGVRNKLNSMGDSSTSKDQPSFFENSCFRVLAAKTYRRKTTDGDKKVEANSNTNNREKRLESGNDDSVNKIAEVQQIPINETDVSKQSELANEEGKANESGESDKSLKELDQSEGNDMCWSMKLSVQSNESLSRENTTKTLNAEERKTTDDSNLDVANKSDTEGASLDNSDSVGKKGNEEETPKATDMKEEKKVVVKDKPKFLAPIQGRTCIVLLEKKDADQYTSTLISRNRDATNEHRVLGKSHNTKPSPSRDDKQSKKKVESSIEGVPSDYDEEYDNSKDSNWSLESSAEFLSESKTSDCPEGTTMRTRSSERSRRESEVWSDFYESLKLAEKLKKSKKRKASCQFDNKKKCLALPDYSSKRVVKKPKRYRQSSDSQDSMGDYEFSESEEEVDVTDKSAADIQSQGQDETEKRNTDMGIEKKQKLLNKIEHFDPQSLDYLFKLLKKREKCFDSFQKHSSLQPSRYSQDLRSYRKKVLKGIKNRSRTYNVLRYQNIMKKKSLDDGLADEFETLEEEEGAGQGARTKTPSPTGSKSGEKKRGRPRKLNSKKLKERRRSDKEVDFIEKNFEKEGGEVSLNKRKRKLSSKLQYYKTSHGSEDKDEFSSGQVITTKSGDTNRKFTCAVCKDIFPDGKVFREHIIIHRMEEGTYQCMECGECFVVRPSLEKHLHAFHKIRNTDKYITDNDCWNIKKDAPEEEGEPLKENQCKVCKDQFDRAVDLTKHFRIHGMAFLKEYGRAK